MEVNKNIDMLKYIMSIMIIFIHVVSHSFYVM